MPKKPSEKSVASPPAKLSPSRQTAAAQATPSVITTATAKAAVPTPSRDEIALRAYEIYVARGRDGGREMEDWAQAEREISARLHRHN